MPFTLQNFEQYIPEAVLKRGLDYLQRGYVEEPEHLGSGRYKAEVQGNDVYEVELNLKNATEIGSHFCTCPYEGEVCKHVAAVLFYLQKDVLQIEIQPEDTPKSTKKTVRQSPSDKMRERLKQTPTSELVDLLMELFATNKTVKEVMKLRFAEQTERKDKTFYAKILKSAIRTAMGREGFLFYGSTGKVAAIAHGLIKEAERELSTGQFEPALAKAQALSEVLIDAIQHADDSNGDLGGSIEGAIDVIRNLSIQPLDVDFQNSLKAYAFDIVRKRPYADWDWQDTFVHIAIALCKEKDEVLELLPLIDRAAKSEWQEETLAEQKLAIYQKFFTEAEANAYLWENRKYSSFRKIILAPLLENKEYKKAWEILEEGIENDKEKRGLVYNWKSLQQRIAIEKQDSKMVWGIGCDLFLNFNDSISQFKLLKDYFGEGPQWQDLAIQLYQDLARKNKHQHHELQEIAFLEKWWDKLLDLLSHDYYLTGIQHYAPHLPKERHPQLLEIYKQNILLFVEKNASRNHYQTACFHLRNMIKLGGSKQAKEAFSTLQGTYPQRRALQEELNAIRFSE